MKNIFETINKFYSHDKNIYHSIYHIKKMLKDYDKNRNDIFYHYPDLNDDIMIDIILWHDAGYLPGDKNNEVLASALYSNNTDRLNPIVINGILSTIPFIKKYDDNYQKIIHDLDWLSFSDYNRLIKEEPLIRNEYPNIDNKLFNQGRKQFLEKMVEIYGNKLYVSKVFEKYNEIALSNIKKRINEL
jgi:predicted metal-dependent HD superfamily phosphohydrolase